MAKEASRSWNAEDWLRIYQSLTDPEKREDRRRATERKKRQEDKLADYGL